QLLAARVGVGVGEATIAPAGYSLLADIVEEKRLATAISIFQMGAVFGGGLAFLAGGAILRLIEGADFSGWPLLSSLAPWQITFIAVALPGVFFLLLLVFIQEPERIFVASGKGVAEPLSGGLGVALRQQPQRYFTLF